jgi:hypothetical protein
MLQREKFQNCYTVTEFKKDLLLKYWIFTNYNNNRDITYYTLEVSECHLWWNYEKIYKFRGIKNLEYTKHIAENYKNYKITKSDSKNFYSSNEMRW